MTLQSLLTPQTQQKQIQLHHLLKAKSLGNMLTERLQQLLLSNLRRKLQPRNLSPKHRKPLLSHQMIAVWHLTFLTPLSAPPLVVRYSLTA
jgi:hypothetical protein